MTFAGTSANGQDAPIPAVRRVTVEPLELTDAPRLKSFKKSDRLPPEPRRILRQRRCSGQGAGHNGGLRPTQAPTPASFANSAITASAMRTYCDRRHQQ